MPNGININGQFVNTPGTYGQIVFDAANGISGLTRNLALVGELPYLPYAVPVEVFSQPALTGLQPADLNLQRIAQTIYEAASGFTAPSSVILCNVQPNTLAFVNVLDGSGNPSVQIDANVYGSVGNQTTVAVALSGGTYTIDLARSGITEQWTAEAVELFDLQYTGTGPSTTVAAGSDGVNISTYAGAGTLNVASTTGFPTTGTIRVATASGVKALSYTGTGGTTFTGVNANGQTGLLATGGAVTTNQWTTVQTGVRPATTVAVGSNGATLPQATINVASTAAFAVAGTLLVVTTEGVEEVTYEGKTATTFIGCAGGTGTLATGNDITPDVPVQAWVAASRASLAIGTFSPACPWDGRVLLTPSGAPSGETYTAAVTGVDAGTGTSITESVTWTDGISTPALTDASFSTLTSIEFSTSGNDTPTFTVAGDINRSDESEYVTAGAWADGLSEAAYSTALFTIANVNDLADSIYLSSMDPLAPTSIATAHTFESSKQAIVDALASSALVTATAISTGGTPVALASTNMAGGSQSAASGSDWTACGVAMRGVACFVESWFSESSSVQQAMSSHLAYMAGPGRNPRNGWVGMPANSTLTQARARTAVLNYRNVGLVVDEIQRASPIGGLEWRSPKWWALQVAAMQCGTDESLTYKVPAIDDFRRSSTIPGTSVANNPAIAAGITILGEPLNGQAAILTRIVRALTTWRTNNDPAQTDVRANQSLNELLNFAFTNMVARVGEPTTLPLKVVRGAWRTVLQDAVGGGIIAGADITTADVVRNANVLLFSCTIAPAYSQEFFVFRVQVAPSSTGTGIVFQQAA